jgi:hypothetical protein
MPGSEIFKAEITNDDSHGSDVIAFAFGDSLIEANDRTNRICASVNALAAFPDPAKDVPALVEALSNIAADGNIGELEGETLDSWLDRADESALRDQIIGMREAARAALARIRAALAKAVEVTP